MISPPLLLWEDRFRILLDQWYKETYLHSVASLFLSGTLAFTSKTVSKLYPVCLFWCPASHLAGTRNNHWVVDLAEAYLNATSIMIQHSTACVRCSHRSMRRPAGFLSGACALPSSMCTYRRDLSSKSQMRPQLESMRLLS